MMDDQLVELSTLDFEVARRFSLVKGEEGPIVAPTPAPADEHRGHAGHEQAHRHPVPTCSPTWAAPDRAGDRVFVTCNASDEVLEIDRSQWRIARRFSTGRGPYNVEVTPDDRVLIVTLRPGGAVEFIDLDTGRRIAHHQSSTSLTHGVVTSPDGRYAFVSVEGVRAEPGKVDIYDLRSFQRVAEVEVRQQAAGIAFWRMEPRPDR